MWEGIPHEGTPAASMCLPIAGQDNENFVIRSVVTKNKA